MREMAGSGSRGDHHLPVIDLTVAVVEQRSALDVLHHDHHPERVSELLVLSVLWIGDSSA
jgi:hypothetical protein